MKTNICKAIGVALIGLAALSVTGACSAAASNAKSPGFENGNSYERMNSEQRLLYVVGVFDGLMMFDTNSPGNAVKKCVTDMQTPSGQLLAIVDKYMTDHPEDWGYSMSSNVYTALRDACIKTGHPLY